jgi:hypothetical protein
VQLSDRLLLVALAPQWQAALNRGQHDEQARLRKDPLSYLLPNSAVSLMQCKDFFSHMWRLALGH